MPKSLEAPQYNLFSLTKFFSPLSAEHKHVTKLSHWLLIKKNGRAEIKKKRRKEQLLQTLFGNIEYFEEKLQKIQNNQKLK